MHNLKLIVVFGIMACAAGGAPLAGARSVVATPPEERMEQRQVAAFTEMMRAVNAGDARSYALLYAEDAVIKLQGSGVLAGRSAIEQYEVELLRQFPGVRLAFYAVWQKGPLAVVHYAVNGNTPSGQAMGHEGLLFYRFHSSGLIEEERRYLDSLTPMAQLGALGAVPARSVPTLPTDMKQYAAQGSPRESANVTLVRKHLGALNSRNESAFLASMSEDAVVDELMQPQPSARKGNAKAWFEMWTRAVPDASFEITSIEGIGDFVLVEGTVRGTLKGQLGYLSPANREFAVHRALMVQIEGGKISRVSNFMNGKELAEAVGQWPPPATK
jgi:uncharacterized protein (TIGR02246 family)